MNYNIFFTLINTVLTLLNMFIYFPLLTARNAQELYDAIQSRPLLAKTVTRKSKRSYVRVCLYFGSSLLVYAVVAVHENVDMNFAALSLFAFFLISLSRVWMLRQMLGKP